MAKNEHFDGHIKDLKRHIKAYRKGRIGEQGLIAILALTLRKLMEVSDKTAINLLRDINGS